MPTVLSVSPSAMLAQVPIEPNELIDTTGVGWEEVIVAGIVLVVSIIAASMVRRLVRRTASTWSGHRPELGMFVSKMAGWLVVLLGVVWTLMILGFQLGPFFLIFGIIAVVLFLSARHLVENFGAGVVIQTENPFRIGDMVEIGDEIGTVREIAGRTTVLDAFDGRTVRIPNSQILNQPIVNYSEQKELRSDLEVGVEYGTDLDRAHDVLVRTLGDVDGVREEPPPEAFATEFADSSIAFTVRYWHDPSREAMYRVTDRVARAIARELSQEGIVIAFPQIVVWPREEGPQ